MILKDFHSVLTTVIETTPITYNAQLVRYNGVSSAKLHEEINDHYPASPQVPLVPGAAIPHVKTLDRLIITRLGDKVYQTRLRRTHISIEVITPLPNLPLLRGSCSASVSSLSSMPTSSRVRYAVVRGIDFLRTLGVAKCRILFPDIFSSYIEAPGGDLYVMGGTVVLSDRVLHPVPSGMTPWKSMRGKSHYVYKNPFGDGWVYYSVNIFEDSKYYYLEMPPPINDDHFVLIGRGKVFPCSARRSWNGVIKKPTKKGGDMVVPPHQISLLDDINEEFSNVRD